ncbi:hypothetical protein P280DRAFT_468537 [Massarina eburnea CBS 473.64]|uniref:Uncharacterized protein n=1 Tax=Massarina eburnea CBS 473.64 TaxID=1395130 RepID=A0A6A6S2H7_9PLEO|nr:hypothetical protein P280DRAFT_468537 [Massarina eburnea CBS 473.64]
MEELVASRLSAKDRATKQRTKRVKKALSKSAATTDAEHLIVEMEFWLPDSIAKLDQAVKFEVIAKLIKELKSGPLGSCKNDAEYLRKGKIFLHSGEGKLWMKEWFLPHSPMPVKAHRRKSSATGVSAPMKLAIAPPSRVRSPSIGAESDKLSVFSSSPSSPRSPAAAVVQQEAFMPALPSPTATSQTNVPSSTSVIDPLTIVCTPSIEAGGVPPAYEPSFAEGLYSPGEGALCLNCWTIHSTKIGGPFVSFCPTRPNTLLDSIILGDRNDDNSGWKKHLTTKNLFLGGALAVGTLALLLNDVNSQTRRS